MRKRIAALLVLATVSAVPLARATVITFTGTKTVGTLPPPACASASTVSVAAGTTVYYCYTLQADANITFPYGLTDDKLGIVNSFGTTSGGFARDFASTVVNAPVTNFAFWTDDGINGTAIANATATVNIIPAVPALAPPALVALGFALLFAGLVLLRRIG